MKLKRFLTCCLSVMMLVCVLNTTTFAATTGSTDDNIFEIINMADSGVATNRAGNETTYVITNPSVIAQLSDSEVLPDKMELTYIPCEDTVDMAAARIFESYEVRNKIDHGDGWYNSNVHQLYEYYIDGPDTFVIDETQSFKASVNCNISAAIDVISSGVGFEIGEEHELHIQSNTPVPSGQRLHVEVFRTHRKVTFDLYEKPLGGSWSKKGNYEALKPNGVFFKKEFWNV